MAFKLKQTVQCDSCPWRVEAKISDIPNYSRDLHENLSSTIAKDNSIGNQLKIMACHHSSDGYERHCIGWVANQLGVGNNISLRLQFRHCSNAQNIKLKGKQKQNFQQTLCD